LSLAQQQAPLGELTDVTYSNGNLEISSLDTFSFSNSTNSVLNVLASSGTNTAGKSLTIAAGQGTGNADGGSIIFQVADGGDSGASANSLSTALTIADNKTITVNNDLTVNGSIDNQDNVLSFNENVLLTRNEIFAKNIKTSHLNNNTWNQIGSDIVGEANGDESGVSVSLSATGKRVAIGAHMNDGNGSSSGQARIYEFNETTLSWSQKGSDIDGEASGDQSGFTLSLSGDGNTVCVAGRSNDSGGSNSGHVKIYRWNGSSWTSIGKL
jgi:hypothetical protein